MVMVMMAKNVSIMGFAIQRRQNVLVMMMMRVGFEPLGSTSHRRTSTVTLFITLGIIILGLSSFGPRSSLTTCFYLIVDLRWHMFHLLASSQSAIWWRQMSTSCNRTGHAQATNTTSNAREHAAELTLDARFSRWSLYLWLGTLHSLWKWRDATSLIDLLYPQEMLLRCHGVRWFFHGSMPGRVIDSRVAIAVSNRGRGWAFIPWPTLWRLLVLRRQ